MSSHVISCVKAKHQRSWKQKLWLFKLHQNCLWHRQNFRILLSLLNPHIFKTKLLNTDQNFSFLVIMFTVIQYLDYKVSTLTCQLQSCSGFSCFSCLVFHWQMTNWKKLYWQQLSWIMLLINVRKCLKHVICSDILSNQLPKSQRDLRDLYNPAEEKITINKIAADYSAEHRTHLVIADSNGLIPL